MEMFSGLARVGADPDMNVNPFSGLCAAPCHFYAVASNAERCLHRDHPRVTRSVEGCADWAKWGSVKEDKEADAADAQGGLHT
jgi:hypothetical protein